MIAWTRHVSPLGPLLLCASERGLTGLYFEPHRHFAGVECLDGVEDPEQPLLKQACAQLDEYFSGVRKDFDLPLDLRGTLFQTGVWQQLQKIPRGQRSTYSRIAYQVSNSHAVRAVGAAIGRNPLCIIVPCHRVLRSDGGLAGYAGGLERKRYLLALEE